MRPSLRPVSFDTIPGWNSDDPSEVLPGLLDCANHTRTIKPYKTGSLGIETKDFSDLFAAVQNLQDVTAETTRRLFESHCIPCLITPEDSESGFVTGYYEPELSVSDRKSDQYHHPIYRRPEDLVDIDDTNRPENWDESFVFGRSTGNGVIEYHDRQAIEQGCLQGRGLEIAWASDRIDVFFMHIQGSGRLRYPDGTVRRVTYAAKTGHPFTAIGRVLIAMGEQHPDKVTMQSLRKWLAQNPERVDSVLWHNRSFIFFREAPVIDASLGPVAAAKVPLRAGRSMAVDRMIHTFGTPIFVCADQLRHLTSHPFRRLMLAQDTGSAIIGPARGDIFTGSGDEAGEQAGTVKHQADFYVLVPKPAVKRILN